MLPRGRRPAFLITIDTEGDNLWAKPHVITTANAAFLPRFQTLCEKYGFKPTWLTNWEMSTNQAFVEFGRAVIARRQGEIGMHLHAWNSPPVVPLTDDDYLRHPYLIEYAPDLIREKIHALTSTLEDAFQVNIVSHRAGRWAFNEIYAQVLLECGYRVDCSVTPHVSWRNHAGVPGGPGGSDYSSFPEEPYFLDLTDIRRTGSSPLLEVPVTIIPNVTSGSGRFAGRLLETTALGCRIKGRLMPAYHWLRPNGRNRRTLLALLETCIADGRDHVEFILHSSEFMPGGSPTFPTERSIEGLYDDLESLFAAASQRFVGLTLSEYYERVRSDSGAV